MLSAWFAGEVTLLPFPYLRVGVLLAYGVSGVCGLRKRSRLPFVVRHPFPVSVGPSPFLDWGGLVTGLWPLLRLLVLDSSDARLHRPDALASGRTLSFCCRGSPPWAFARTWISRPRPCLGSSLLWGGAHLPLSWVFAWRLWPLDGPGTCSFLGPYLGFFPLASSVGCWLKVVEVYP